MVCTVVQNVLTTRVFEPHVNTFLRHQHVTAQFHKDVVAFVDITHEVVVVELRANVGVLCCDGY